MELKVTAELVPEDLLDEEPGERSALPEIKFVGRVGGAEVWSFQPEEGAPTLKWLTLADACQRGGCAIQDWGPGNGLMHIRVNIGGQGLVEFATGKFGDGRGGATTTLVSAGCCVDAFREAALITEGWIQHSESEA